MTIKTGTKVNNIIKQVGDSTKPVSGYGEARSDNYLLSSAGIKFNSSNTTLDISHGIDNTGFRVIRKSNEIDKSYGIIVNGPQLKIGYEYASIVKWDERTTVTNYTNISITFMGIYAAYAVLTGQFQQLQYQQQLQPN